jgi:hypothetical protein
MPAVVTARCLEEIHKKRMQRIEEIRTFQPNDLMIRELKQQP